MKTAKDRKSKAAKEIESDMEEREESRREAEQHKQKYVTQGMQTGTGDAVHPGINWGSSYTTRRKARPKKSSGSKR